MFKFLAQLTMPDNEGEPIIIHQRCRVRFAEGLAGIDAAQRVAKSPQGCPMTGVVYRYILHARYGTLDASTEIASHLPHCNVCSLPVGTSDFQYNIPNPDGSDEIYPLLP